MILVPSQLGHDCVSVFFLLPSILNYQITINLTYINHVHFIHITLKTWRVSTKTPSLLLTCFVSSPHLRPQVFIRQFTDDFNKPLQRMQIFCSYILSQYSRRSISFIFSLSENRRGRNRINPKLWCSVLLTQKRELITWL